MLTPSTSPGGRGAAQAAGHEIRPLPGEAHAVDHGLVLDQPEEPRLRVARLRARGDRADFDMAKAQAGQPAPAQAVFVVAGRQPDRVGKAQAKGLHRAGSGGRKQRAQHRRDRRQGARQAQQAQGERVRLLGVEAEEQRAK